MPKPPTPMTPSNSNSPTWVPTGNALRAAALVRGGGADGAGGGGGVAGATLAVGGKASLSGGFALMRADQRPNTCTPDAVLLPVSRMVENISPAASLPMKLPPNALDCGTKAAQPLQLPEL
jgi:hypothetical protein